METLIGGEMTDSEQARDALAEVARRREETTRLAGIGTNPAWIIAVGALVMFVLGMVTDLRTQIPELNGWFTRWAVPMLGAAIMVALAVVAYRRASVSLHSSASGRQIATIAILVVAFWVCLMAIGMPMRYYRIPFDQTVSFLGAFVLVGLGWLVWRAVCARRG